MITQSFEFSKKRFDDDPFPEISMIGGSDRRFHDRQLHV